MASALAPVFSSKIRRRGADYFRYGAVVDLHHNGVSLAAVVDGHMDTYLVCALADHGSKTLRLRCDCPYWSDRREPCKHMWATLLAAETTGAGIDIGSCTRIVPLADPGAELFSNDFAIENVTSKLAAMVDPTLERGWRAHLDAISRESVREAPSSTISGDGMAFVIDPDATLAGRGYLAIEVMDVRATAAGKISMRPWKRLTTDSISRFHRGIDRTILELFAGLDDRDSWERRYINEIPRRVELAPPVQQTLVQLMCHSGRAMIRVHDDQPPSSLTWDDGPPWRLILEVTDDAEHEVYRLTAELHRDDQSMPLAAPALLSAAGLVFTDDRVARLDESATFQWIARLRSVGVIETPHEDGAEFVARLLSMPTCPEVRLPDSLDVRHRAVAPSPRLHLHARGTRSRRLVGRVSFIYDGSIVPADDLRRGCFDAESGCFIPRDPQAEAAAHAQLDALGLERLTMMDADAEVSIASDQLPRVVRELGERGWLVEAEGKVFRSASDFTVGVRSGIDWFELHGSAMFGEQTVPLPELLEALRDGSDAVQLDDGTYGLLPEDWLSRYAGWAELGKAQGDHVRFEQVHAFMLDAMLAEQPEVSCDEAFSHARRKLAKFDGIKPRKAPARFEGELRTYQREGLGWMHFLREFQLNGCLADDMGLGKTVQALALLESRRVGRTRRVADGGAGPSLIVVPRSLISHWNDEAGRFTPRMRLRDHTGSERTRDESSQDPIGDLSETDLVITTYGTLRRDAALLHRVPFDYVILDEAQAIKNSTTVTSKAARLLQARHRLALSGTPIENHIGELFSLFAFLQPGLLASYDDARSRQLTEEDHRIIGKTVRPFVLRRTKEQVAPELPPKTEDDLFVDLGPTQRKQYDQLRDHYRRSLLEKVDARGLNRSKMHVLEALLRLRQAACHPSLVSGEPAKSLGAKIEMMLPMLDTAIEDNHKVLIFSQFTKLLAIVRDALDTRGVVYEYLDGRTRDRASRVERFQNDPHCHLFLISLKAGGTGLNLTAADYVFLLDPWWNPAVETQAIDRTHRIGQQRPVFAYRMLARDTVEDRIRELQHSKRALTDRVFGDDQSLIRSLTRDELQLLLS